MSQSSIATTNFLELCISKKRTIQDITESLGLDRETADPRKEPVFLIDEANDLQKRIKEYAEAFKAKYRNNKERMLADLVKDGLFASEVRELGDRYGQSLWGRQRSIFPQELSWDKEADQQTIRHYLRYWITSHAVQASATRKGKARASAASRELSESENSDVELLGTRQRPTSVAMPTLPFRAPERHNMLPPAELSRTDNSAVQTKLVDNEGSLDIGHESEARSPMTPPNKRKAFSFQGQLSSGKLQKVAKDARAATTTPRGRQRNVYSISTSPAPQFPVRPGSSLLTVRNQREDTCDTDRTFAPPGKKGTIGSDTELDPDEVMAHTQELLSDIQTVSDGETVRDLRSPTAGPSGTYRNNQGQDSVTLPSTQQGAEDLEDHDASPRHHQSSNASKALMSTIGMDVSKPDPWEERQLRLELFKLLLSYLNNINQFSPDAYEPEAEDRMNSLLHHFWINDAEALRLQTSERFPALKGALEQWIKMRYAFLKFQCTTGYFGKPGDGWREHWQRLDGRVARAKASIAFADLKSSASITLAAASEESTFNDNLAMVFDLLTQVEGSNGVKEFDALRLHNEGLLEWFS